MARFQELTTPIMVSAGVGVADGFLARQDVNSPTRAQRQLSQFSFWGELAGVGGGLLINQQSRTPFQDNLAVALIASSVALIARRGGVLTAESMETGVPQVPTFAAPQPTGMAAGQAFAPMRMLASGRGAGQYLETAAMRASGASQGRFL